jgi:hypothetical protein
MTTNPTGAAAAVEPSELDTAWTGKEVCELFSEVMSGAVLVAGRGGVHPVGQLKPGRPKVLNWAFRYLTPAEQGFMFLWAGHEYRIRHGMTDLKRWEYYREKGMGSASTVSTKKKRLCEKIAVCLRRDGIAKFKLRPITDT